MVAQVVWEVADAVAATASAGRRPLPCGPLKHFIEQVPCKDNEINCMNHHGKPNSSQTQQETKKS
jgi:hypothetical protein